MFINGANEVQRYQTQRAGCAAVDSKCNDTLAEVETLVNQAHIASQQGNFSKAEQLNRRAIALDPDRAIAHNNLGWVLQSSSDYESAIDCYTTALKLDPALRIARRNLAIALLHSGKLKQSLRYWHQELSEGQCGVDWMDQLIANAMEQDDLAFAGKLAKVFSRLRWASHLNPLTHDTGSSLKPVTPPVHITVNKLKHDIEQLKYLISNQVTAYDLGPVLKDYEAALITLKEEQPDAHVPLERCANGSIDKLFNKVLHVRQSPRHAQALSDSWQPAEVESRYLGHHPGIVVIDDFLSSEVLEELRLFCNESTVWSANRYPHGRLGAFFREGFNTPLLRQISEELRFALPNVIGKRHPLRQLWGFKNTESVPGNSSIHADFAAVNVNFWITPTDANLDPQTGGMTIYEADAPADWDFHSYNANSDLIRSYLRRAQAKSLRIPYRENRAIIFNSDLFHETDEVNFKPGYENRRINITMLYGNRENDTHHQPYSWQAIQSATSDAWKSASFSRTRRAS